MSDARETTWKGRSEQLKIITVKKSDCDYTVTIEFGEIETVIVSRPLNCDRQAGTQEHQ